MHLAAAENNVEMVEFLLSSNVISVTAKDRWGRTAEDEATSNGFNSLVEVLRKWGAQEGAEGQDSKRQKAGE